MASSSPPSPSPAPSQSIVSNTIQNTDRSRDLSRRKKKKAYLRRQQQQPEDQDQSENHRKWKSQAKQQIYSSKLCQSLARMNLGSALLPSRSKAVREAADRVLAVTAKGSTRWSRAILRRNQLKLKFTKHKPQRMAITVPPSRSKKPRIRVYRLKEKNAASVQRKVKFLGRLVPGCRKEPLPVILEEAIDYIPALEMQVRAMTTLVNLLSVSSSTSSPPSL